MVMNLTNQFFISLPLKRFIQSFLSFVFGGIKEKNASKVVAKVLIIRDLIFI
jgi:hypothetical protein